MVGVVGKRTDADRRWCDHAFLIGRTLADAGCVVVTGGMGGVMAAAAEGAHKARGFVLSLLPEVGPGVDDVHPWADLTIRTGLHHSTRNIVMGTACDALVACPGGMGTVQEMAVALDAARPVVWVSPWEPPALVDRQGVIRLSGYESLGRFCELLT